MVVKAGISDSTIAPKYQVTSNKLASKSTEEGRAINGAAAAARTSSKHGLVLEKQIQDNDETQVHC